MKAFIFIKTTIPNEANLRAQVIRNSGEPLFCVPYWDLRCYMYTTKKRVPCDNFFKNHELWTKKMVYLKWALANLQNMTIYYHSGIYWLSIGAKSSLCADYFVPLKKMYCAWHKWAQTFSSAVNLRIIFIKSFSWIIAPPLPFFNEILFLQ